MTVQTFSSHQNKKKETYLIHLDRSNMIFKIVRCFFKNNKNKWYFIFFKMINMIFKIVRNFFIFYFFVTKIVRNLKNKK